MKRKTSITKIAGILTVLAMVWGGVACKQTTEPEAPVEKTKYTISFDSGVKSITVEEGTAATKPTDPEKTGYTFGGWLNGKAAYDWTQPVTSNLSLTAKWTAIKYTITYLPEGVKTDNPTNYTIETETFALTNPTNQPVEGKPYFVAWHNGKKPAEGEWAIVDSIIKGTTGNKTFYAEFSAEESCVVKFMSGTTEVESTKVKKGDKITLPNDFEKYSLFSDADCTEAFDTNTAITADTTIYVKLKTFTISYKVLPFDEVSPVEGKTNGTMTVEYGKVFTDEEINALAEVIDGYAYKGVFTDKACTVPFDNTQAITSNLTVYVLYEKVVEETATQTWTPFGTLTLAENKWESDGVANGNYQATLSVLPADYQAKTGDVIRIKLKGTSNKDLDNFQVCLIDNGENTNGQGSWGYVPISDYIPIAEKVVADEAFDFTVNIPVKKDSSQAGSSYCKISLQAGTWTSDDSESRVLTLDMPDVLSLDVKSLTNGYGTIVSVNDDGSVTLKADNNKYGQAGIQLGGCQDLSDYSKLKIEYTASAQIQVKFGTTANLYGAATTISYPDAVETKTLKEIDISEKVKNAVYSIMVGPNGDDSTTMTIYSITLEK